MSSRRNGHLANGGEARSPGGRGFGRGEGGAFGGGVSTSRYTPSGTAGGADYIAAGHEERRAAGGGATERTPWTPGGRSRDPAATPEPAFGVGRADRSALTSERRNLRGTTRREVPEAGTCYETSSYTTADCNLFAAEASPRIPAAIGGQTSWRANNRSATSSGTFEGVLGFSGTAVNKPPAEAVADGSTPASQWRDRNDSGTGGNGIQPSTGGGSGWGKGRWRAAAQEREAADRETVDRVSPSEDFLEGRADILAL